MGVYIKGMVMPKECRDCQMMAYYVNTGKTWCTPVNRILADKYKTISFDGRPNWCPLVEVKEPHGDLIDKDKLIEDIANQVPYIIDDSDAQSYTNGLGAAKVSADTAPVVIKGEGEEP